MQTHTPVHHENQQKQYCQPCLFKNHNVQPQKWWD